MRIYAALSPSTPSSIDLLREIDYPWVLAAFKATVDPMSLPYRPGLLLDSGAFAVWNSGKTIDVGDYITWATELRASYGSDVQVINLDVIPGTPDRTPSEKEKAAAIVESADNAEIIRAAGLPVIEVYHRYEHLDVLDAILERRRPGEIIALGGLVGRAGGTTAKIEFCRRSFSHLRDHGGFDALPPVHGLGVSGDAPLARRFPWWSVDSTTWATQRNFNLHVSRSGGFKPRNRETAPRTTKDMVLIFTRRRLEMWQRYEKSITAEWERRGVRFASV